ncbi:MAG: oxidoreductase, partial [Gordonia sp. (in: high G+C Gram-positive bacteria)]
MRTPTRDTTVDHPAPHRGIVGAAAAFAGILAVGAALAVGELIAAVTGPESSPYLAVGSTLVDHLPEGPREWAITTFGTADKTALFLGMGAVIAVIAVIAGIAERRWGWAGVSVIGVFAVVGVFAAIGRPDASSAAAMPSILAGVVGVVVIRVLIGALGDRVPSTVPSTVPNTGADDGPGVAPAPLSRRFVLLAGVIGAGAVAAGAIGRTLLADAARTVADRGR